MNEDVTRPNRNLLLLHPIVLERWTDMKPELEGALQCLILVNEAYRSDARQAWLYGAGRSAGDMARRGLDTALARPGDPVVTNAWSAKLSAHGWTEDGQPASVALDIVPLGKDGKPWTKDDPWAQFVELTTDYGPFVTKYRMRHFHAPGKEVTDKPHIQAVEWSDRDHAFHYPA